MVDKVEIDPSATQQNNIAPLGEVLLAARKAKKLTHKDISNSLRLSIKQIDAIEKNEFSLLPVSYTHLDVYKRQQHARFSTI